MLVGSISDLQLNRVLHPCDFKTLSSTSAVKLPPKFFSILSPDLLSSIIFDKNPPASLQTCCKSYLSLLQLLINTYTQARSKHVCAVTVGIAKPPSIKMLVTPPLRSLT